MLYGLSEKTLNELSCIFKKYSGIEQVIIYGSRAKGNYKPGSDIDITLKTDASFSRSNFLKLYGDLEDSYLPYFVDLSIYSEIDNPNLISHIDRVGKELL